MFVCQPLGKHKMFEVPLTKGKLNIVQDKGRIRGRRDYNNLSANKLKSKRKMVAQEDEP